MKKKIGLLLSCLMISALSFAGEVMVKAPEPPEFLDRAEELKQDVDQKQQRIKELHEKELEEHEEKQLAEAHEEIEARQFLLNQYIDEYKTWQDRKQQGRISEDAFEGEKKFLKKQLSNIEFYLKKIDQKIKDYTQKLGKRLEKPAFALTRENIKDFNELTTVSRIPWKRKQQLNNLKELAFELLKNVHARGRVLLDERYDATSIKDIRNELQIGKTNKEKVQSALQRALWEWSTKSEFADLRTLSESQKRSEFEGELEALKTRYQEIYDAIKQLDPQTPLPASLEDLEFIKKEESKTKEKKVKQEPTSQPSEQAEEKPLGKQVNIVEPVAFPEPISLSEQVQQMLKQAQGLQQKLENQKQALMQLRKQAEANPKAVTVQSIDEQLKTVSDRLNRVTTQVIRLKAVQDPESALLRSQSMRDILNNTKDVIGDIDIKLKMEDNPYTSNNPTQIIKSLQRLYGQK